MNNPASKTRHRIGLIASWAAGGFIIALAGNDAALEFAQLVSIAINLGIILGFITARFIWRGLI